MRIITAKIILFLLNFTKINYEPVSSKKAFKSKVGI